MYKKDIKKGTEFISLAILLKMFSNNIEEKIIIIIITNS